ncbi:MAG: hypothetical protein FWE02_04655 [Defluviitaleaceae bacterium]|nr:hypothetical protein [Defluviitaleaceae bacterium]
MKTTELSTPLGTKPITRSVLLITKPITLSKSINRSIIEYLTLATATNKKGSSQLLQLNEVKKMGKLKLNKALQSEKKVVQ